MKKVCPQCGSLLKQERQEHPRYSFLKEWFYVCQNPESACDYQEAIDTSVFTPNV